MNKIMRVELLVLTTGKEIKDGEICVIGQGVPMAAGAIAKKYHAPNSIILTEAGMIDIDCIQNLESVGDPGSTIGYSYCIDLWDVFTSIVNRGLADISILGCAQIDKYGNINSTVIGKYDMSKRSYFRLPGSGGANEFAGHSNRTVYTMVGGKFKEKLDYLTTPGWLSGGDSRQKAGLPGGPSALITKYGVFRFEEVTKEIYLDSLFPQTTLEQVKEVVPWELKTAENFGNKIKNVPLPKKEDVEYIREFEPFFGISGNLGRRLQSQVLPVYYEQGNVPHE